MDCTKSVKSTVTMLVVLIAHSDLPATGLDEMCRKTDRRGRNKPPGRTRKRSWLPPSEEPSPESSPVSRVQI